MQQSDKKEPPAAVPAGGKPPGFCDRLQRAFHARPAFRPLRRLTVRHQDGAAKPADAGAAPAEPARKHGSPPVPAPPQPLTPSAQSPVGGAPAPAAPTAPQPVPVRLPTVTATTGDKVAKKAAVSNVPTGLPVPAPPPDVTAGVPAAADATAGDKAQQTKGTTRVGFRVRKALSSK